MSTIWVESSDPCHDVIDDDISDEGDDVCCDVCRAARCWR